MLIFGEMFPKAEKMTAREATGAMWRFMRFARKGMVKRSSPRVTRVAKRLLVLGAMTPVFRAALETGVLP